MYINCQNQLAAQFARDIHPNQDIFFGTKKHRIDFYRAARSCKKIMSVNQFSDCSDATIKSIIDYIYGTQIQINRQNVDELFKISIEMGIIEIIESCDLFKKANEKIQTAMDRLLQEKVDNSLLDFVSRFFHIFTLYQQFLTIKPKLLDSILSRNFLGIYSEYSLFEFLIKYNQQQKIINPNDTESTSLLQRINYQGLTMAEQDKLYTEHPQVIDVMIANRNQKYPQRIFISNPDSSKGFRSILTQIINTSM